MAKFVYFSDLHLEGSNLPTSCLYAESVEADAIICAGDLCVEETEYGFSILRNAAPDLPIVFVPGNHDFEGTNYQDQLKLLKKQGENFDIHVLLNETIQLLGCNIIGGCAWTGFYDINGFPGQMLMQTVSSLIHDFRSIYFNGKPITPQEMKVLHEDFLVFLEAELERLRTEKTIVVTHFPLFKDSVSKKVSEGARSLDGYFVNDLEARLAGLADVFIHGHVHESMNYDLFGSKVFCNPRGFSRSYGLASNVEFCHKFFEL